MEFSFKLWINQGLLGPYYSYMVGCIQSLVTILLIFVEFVYAILSRFHAQEKLPGMHVQPFPVYVLTCGAHNSEPLLSFDLGIDSNDCHHSLLIRLDLYDEF